MVNTAQKVVLAIGVIAFCVIIAMYPAKYQTTVNNPNFDPNYQSKIFRQQQYMEVERIDIGTTSLRGFAALAATAVAFIIAGSRKDQ